MNKGKMKEKLAVLRSKSPELFDELIAAYQEAGVSAFEEQLPPARKGNASTKNTRESRARVWAWVELCMFREGLDVKNACIRLDNSGLETIKQYKTPNNRWRVGKEQEPEVFDYDLPGWQSIKGLYYQADRNDADEKALAESIIRLELTRAEWEQWRDSKGLPGGPFSV